MHDYQEAYFDSSVSQCRISFLRHFALPFSAFARDRTSRALLALPRSPSIQFRLSGVERVSRTWLNLTWPAAIIYVSTV